MSRWIDIALVVLAAGLVGAAATHYLREHGAADANVVLEEGRAFEVGGRKWRGERNTPILLLSTDCPACTQDALFYQMLSKQARSNGLRVEVMMPQDPDRARLWLREQYVEYDEFRRIKPSFLRARGTPTILVLGGNGIVENIWTGKLPPREQSDVLTIVTGRTASGARASEPSRGSVPDEISFAYLQDIRKERKVQLLDVRGRSHFASHHLPGAINLPLDELEIRGPIELDPYELIVLDCIEVPAPVCDMAARLLFSAGFHEVTMLKNQSSVPSVNSPRSTCADSGAASQQ